MEEQITIGARGNDAPRQTGEAGDGWFQSGMDAGRLRTPLMLGLDETDPLTHEGF